MGKVSRGGIDTGNGIRGRANVSGGRGRYGARRKASWEADIGAPLARPLRLQARQAYPTHTVRTEDSGRVSAETAELLTPIVRAALQQVWKL